MDADDFDSVEINRRLYDLAVNLRELRQAITAAQGEPGDAQDDDGGEWARFLDDHPELRGFLFPAGTTVDGEPRPESWRYSSRQGPDDGLFAALARALARKPGGVTSADVARELWGADSLPGHTTRIGHIFYGLHLRGRVVRGGREGTLRVWTLPAAAEGAEATS